MEHLYSADFILFNSTAIFKVTYSLVRTISWMQLMLKDDFKIKQIP